MRYYKVIDSNYIFMVGIGNGGIEISEAEYNQILEVIKNKPVDTSTVYHRLRTDLIWDEITIDPPEPEDDEIGDEEALEILLGL